MPELPEVEITAGELRAAKLLAPIVAVDGQFPCRVFHDCSPRTLADSVIGRRIQGIGRRGKYLLFNLDDGATLVLHRGMSGGLRVRDRASTVDRYVRLTLTFADGRALDFSDPRLFGRVVFFRQIADRKRYLDERLGRDALAPVEASELRSLFGRRRQAIKLLLLDQHLLAGIGNLYADETLWSARVHPATPGNRLTGSQYAALAPAISTVLQASLRRGGTTSARDHLAAEALLPAGERLLQVYGRCGRLCPRCATPIIRIVLGGRGTYICPTCQSPF
jgi:formamidopyrimidine-DNA glycosylase